MRVLAALGALCFLAGGSVALAQVAVSAQTERSDFLLYERVDVIVTLTNASENDLVLDNSEGHPWLSFLVSKHNRLPVSPERSATFKPVTLKVGETKTLRVNITPLFSFREEGEYRAQVVIDLPGNGQIISDGVPFTVLRGRQVWSQTRPVDGSQRVYSLIRFSPQPDRTNLYLRVEDPSENVVYTNLSLGEVVAYVDPEVFFDPQGNLHVLQPIAMSTYLYTSGNLHDLPDHSAQADQAGRRQRHHCRRVGGKSERPARNAFAGRENRQDPGAVKSGFDRRRCGCRCKFSARSRAGPVLEFSAGGLAGSRHESGRRAFSRAGFGA
jgi:hypothetical protein